MGISAALQATYSIEVPQGVLSVSPSSNELRNSIFVSALNINSDVTTFSLPLNWFAKEENSTRKKNNYIKNDVVDEESLDDGIIKLMDARVRRSNRGLYHKVSSDDKKKKQKEENVNSQDMHIHFYPVDGLVFEEVSNQERNYGNKEGPSAVEDTQDESLQSHSNDQDSSCLVSLDRQEVESMCEYLHEAYYARLFHETASQWTASNSSDDADLSSSSRIGLFSDNSFPPYLGRIYQGTWEIRTPYIAPALRWVIRGLIKSGHLGEMEPMSTATGTWDETAKWSEPRKGVVSVSNLYYWNHELRPLDVVEVKKTKVRSKNALMAEEQKKRDEERELSEYEQDRARRIARNQEKLRALGLG